MNEGKKENKLSFSGLYRKYGILIVLVLIFCAAAIASKNFLKPSNLINILKQITPFGVIACGSTMLIISGNIDLSAGTSLALCACTGAKVLQVTGSVFLCFLTAMALGAIIGYINGTLVTRFDLPPFIATLAMMNVCEGVTFITTKSRTIMGVEKLRWLGQGTFLGLPNLVILFAIVLALTHIIMNETQFGLHMYAIGGNSQASVAAGINVKRKIRMFYVYEGAMVGLAGVVVTSRMLSGQPTVGPGYEFDAITATVIGGTSFTGGVGSMFCVIVGSVIIGIINNVMILTGLNSNWQTIVKGILIALAVIIDLKTKVSKRN